MTTAARHRDLNHRTRELDSQARSINPYAVVRLHDRSEPEPSNSGHVSSLTLVIGTIAGITVSAAFFGILLLFVGTLALDRSDANVVRLVSMAIFGCFVAFVGAMAIVPLMSAASRFVRTPARKWSATNIRIFATSCGFLTGYLCIPLLYGNTLWSATVGLVPGAIGAVATAVAVIPLVRSVGSIPSTHP